MLLAEPGISEKKFLGIRNDAEGRIKKILSSLESEGFIIRDNDQFFLQGGPGIL
jgi:hypothetical protein